MAMQPTDEDIPFRVTALLDYDTAYNEELQLFEDQIYIILQVSESGWWYARDEDEFEGWIPMNYVQRIENDDWIPPEEPEPEQEPEPQQPEPEPEPEPTPVQPTVSQMHALADPAPGTGYATSTMRIRGSIDVYGNKLPNSTDKKTAEPPPTQQTRPPMEAKSSLEPPIGAKKFKRQGKTGGRGGDDGRFRTLSNPPPRPMQTVVLTYQGTPRGTYQEKDIKQWNVDNTLNFIRDNYEHGDHFKLTQALRYLTQLAHSFGKKDEVARKGGITVVFTVLRLHSDIAIVMSCCTSIAAMATSRYFQKNPCDVGSARQLQEIVQLAMGFPNLLVKAFNAVTNFTHENPHHTQLILQTDLTSMILDGLNRFRFGENDRKNKIFANVQAAGCQTLRNLTLTEAGQRQVGQGGVSSAIDAVAAHDSVKPVVNSAFGLLSNLCCIPENVEAVIEGNGIDVLQLILTNEDTEPKTQQNGLDVLRNIAAGKKTCALLVQDEGQGISLMMEVFKLEEIESPMFPKIIQSFASLLFNLPNELKPPVISRILEEGFLPKCVEALDTSENGGLHQFIATCCVVMVQVDTRNCRLFAEEGISPLLIISCQSHALPQLIHCSMAIFFKSCTEYDVQSILLDNDLLDLLTGEWYKTENLQGNTLQLGLGVLLHVLSNILNRPYVTRKDYIQKSERMLKWLNSNKPELARITAGVQEKLLNFK